MTTLGKRVKQLREKNNLTQRDLAEILGFKSIRAAQYVEADQRGLDHLSIIVLADYFDVSIDYLVGRTDDPRRH